MTSQADIQYNILGCAVLTVSDTRTEDSDTSGNFLAACLNESGHVLRAKALVKDDRYAIRAMVSAWIADAETDVVLITGGTGLTGRDGTPEAIRPLLDKEVEGFGELFRWISYQEIGSSALQTRALAGVANGTYIFCLPGSQHACSTAWRQLLRHQLDAGTKPCNLVLLHPRLQER